MTIAYATLKTTKTPTELYKQIQEEVLKQSNKSPSPYFSVRAYKQENEFNLIKIFAYNLDKVTTLDSWLYSASGIQATQNFKIMNSTKSALLEFEEHTRYFIDIKKAIEKRTDILTGCTELIFHFQTPTTFVLNGNPISINFPNILAFAYRRYNELAVEANLPYLPTHNIDYEELDANLSIKTLSFSSTEQFVGKQGIYKVKLLKPLPRDLAILFSYISYLGLGSQTSLVKGVVSIRGRQL